LGVLAGPFKPQAAGSIPAGRIPQSLYSSHFGERETDPVFPSRVGSCLDSQKLRKRVLNPAREQAGLPWVGFHAFRHTCATLLFAEGRNAVQVQRWLGHHSAAFTLATYVHLLDGDIGEPLTVSTGACGPELAKRRACADLMDLSGPGASGRIPSAAFGGADDRWVGEVDDR
jgi:Phage integrase family